MADQTEALPYIGKALLGGLQTRANLLLQYGDQPDAATVQQQHDRRLRIAGLAIEHLQSIDRNGSVSGGWDRRQVLD